MKSSFLLGYVYNPPATWESKRGLSLCPMSYAAPKASRLSYEYLVALSQFAKSAGSSSYLTLNICK